MIISSPRPKNAFKIDPPPDLEGVFDDFVPLFFTGLFAPELFFAI
jgi:hypothetical protein